MFKYLISGASEVHPSIGMQISFLIRFVRLKMGFPVTLKWEILNVPFFPGCRFFPFRLYSLVFKCHACADPEGGGGG